MSEQIDVSLPVVVPQIVIIDQKLSDWRKSLPSNLLSRPWEDRISNESVGPQEHTVFSRLSVVTRLRYLNTRILLHRPVLDSVLRKIAASDDAYTDDAETDGESTLSEFAGKSSLSISQSCAVEIIDITHRVSTSKALLGAWWFSVYYSKFVANIRACPNE